MVHKIMAEVSFEHVTKNNKKQMMKFQPSKTLKLEFTCTLQMKVLHYTSYTVRNFQSNDSVFSEIYNFESNDPVFCDM